MTKLVPFALTVLLLTPSLGAEAPEPVARIGDRALVFEGGRPSFRCHVTAVKTERGLVVIDAAVSPSNSMEGLHAANLEHLYKQLLEPVDVLLRTALETGGVEAARARFDAMSADASGRYYIGEAELNALGYEYLLSGRTAEGLAVFRMMVDRFPDSWNAWDSLGEGYWNAGQKEESIRCYEKSLELNPDNANGRLKLRQIQAAK